MAMTAEERYNIALNIVARVGIEGDVIGEYSKAMSRLNAFSTISDMETQGLAGMAEPMDGGQQMTQPPVPPTNGLGGDIGNEQRGMM